MCANETPPYRFGSYRLVERLGSGSMAEVFKAILEGAGGFEKTVALKVYRAELSHDPDFAPSFISEARLGGLLSHENIVASLDFGRHEDRLYLAMEYVRGPSLLALLRRHRKSGAPIPPHVALEIGIQVCRGLDYAHRAKDHDGRPLKMVHRDLKPSNILIDPIGTVKIADFGVARAESNAERTVVPTLKGTLRYMSPEQAAGAPSLDHRSDLFAVGLILFELLTLQRMYEGNDRDTVLEAARGARIEPRLALLPPTPVREALRTFLLRALSRNLDQRFRSGGEMAEQLETIRRRLPPSPTLRDWLKSVPGSPPPPSPGPARLEDRVPEGNGAREPAVNGTDRVQAAWVATTRLNPNDLGTGAESADLQATQRLPRPASPRPKPGLDPSPPMAGAETVREDGPEALDTVRATPEPTQAPGPGLDPEPTRCARDPFLGVVPEASAQGYPDIAAGSTRATATTREGPSIPVATEDPGAGPGAPARPAGSASHSDPTRSAPSALLPIAAEPEPDEDSSEIDLGTVISPQPAPESRADPDATRLLTRPDPSSANAPSKPRAEPTVVLEPTRPVPPPPQATAPPPAERFEEPTRRLEPRFTPPPQNPTGVRSPSPAPIHQQAPPTSAHGIPAEALSSAPPRKRRRMAFLTASLIVLAVAFAGYRLRRPGAEPASSPATTPVADNAAVASSPTPHLPRQIPADEIAVGSRNGAKGTATDEAVPFRGLRGETRVQPPRPAHQTSTTAPLPSSDTGLVTLESTPKARYFLDEKPVPADTAHPLRVTPGPHQVTFYFSGGNILEARFRVRTGQHVRCSADWQAQTAQCAAATPP